MPRLTYIYNAHTCKYEPVVVTGRALLKSSLVFLGFSFVLGLAGLYYFNKRHPLWDETQLEEHNAGLRDRWNLLQTKLGEVAEHLAAIERNDDSNYRMILDLKPLEASERQAGAGGHESTGAAFTLPMLRSIFSQADNVEQRLRVEQQSMEKLHRELGERERMWASRPAIQPVSNKDLTHLHTLFGMRFHPLLGYVRPHKGLDFTAPKGSPVYATGDGVVEQADYSVSYGNVVYIDHGYRFKTRYAHLSKFIVMAGERVKRGQVIGYVGNTGISVSAHLHYEVLFNGEQVNPINFFQRDLNNKEYERLIELGSQSVVSLD
jgi:murein DD-endopeptidase MepM/ murein hydrolase activator NlpD